MCHNIIDCGFKIKVKIAIYNAKVWQNMRELLCYCYVRAVICVMLVYHEFYSMAVS